MLHDGGQLRPRIEQPQRRLQRERVRALLDHAGALAVVLADDDERAASHACRCEIGERVGGHVGADDGFPGDRAAHRIVDGSAQHGCCRGFVGAGLQVDAEFAQQILGLQQDIEQVADRRALIAADIGHTRLQQRLGDREDALAAKLLAVAQPQTGDLFAERNFQRHVPSLFSAAQSALPQQSAGLTTRAPCPNCCGTKRFGYPAVCGMGEAKATPFLHYTRPTDGSAMWMGGEAATTAGCVGHPG